MMTFFAWFGIIVAALIVLAIICKCIDSVHDFYLEVKEAKDRDDWKRWYHEKNEAVKIRDATIKALQDEIAALQMRSEYR